MIRLSPIISDKGGKMWGVGCDRICSWATPSCPSHPGEVVDGQRTRHANEKIDQTMTLYKEDITAWQLTTQCCSGSHQQKEYHPSLWSILLHQVVIIAITIKMVIIDIFIFLIRFPMWTSPSIGWLTRTSNRIRNYISSLLASLGEIGIDTAEIIIHTHTLITIIIITVTLIIVIIIWLQVGAGSMADLHTDRPAHLSAHKVFSSWSFTEEWWWKDEIMIIMMIVQKFVGFLSILSSDQN